MAIVSHDSIDHKDSTAGEVAPAEALLRAAKRYLRAWHRVDSVQRRNAKLRRVNHQADGEMQDAGEALHLAEERMLQAMRPAAVLILPDGRVIMDLQTESYHVPGGLAIDGPVHHVGRELVIDLRGS